MRSIKTSLPLLLAGVLLLSVSCSGSPPPPIVRAAQSANGQWLVTVEQKLSPQLESDGGRRVLSTIYHVLSSETFLNSSRDRLDALGTLWSERWFLTQSAADALSPIVWPMISDDGKTLVLVNVTAPFSKSKVLSIYREDRLEPKCLRTYTIENLWPAEKIDSKLMDVGYTPQWFMGGQLRFSEDDRNLLYQTQWGTRVTMRLSDGAINPQPSPF